jgi:lambda family phage portal protein
MAGLLKTVMNAFGIPSRATPPFEASGNGRRLRGFNPSKNHINVAIQKAGPTLLARARWLYENEGFCGNAVDEWASAAISDGIKPRPRIKDKAKKRELLDLFWRWTEEADADGMSDFYGLQEKIAREVFIAGECFVRIRSRRPGDMWTVPFQLQMLQSEMLDTAYNATAANGNYIRAGIEFDSIGRRVAYHFWRWHPYDDRPPMAATMRDRVIVDAADVVHILEGRQGGQIRGVPRVARILVKVFGLEIYDDAELERKKTSALFTAFLVGRGEVPLDLEGEDQTDDGDPIASMEPGAIIDLGDERDIRFSSPTEVGGSYEPFQYRNLLKICAGLGMPYAIVTGDVTRGNFSNVRTSIIQFRRRVNQWQYNTIGFQLLRPVWKTFVERAYLSGLVELPGYDKDPSVYWAAEWLMPRSEWIDPERDVAAEKDAIKAGLKSRTQAVAERGYDREDLDDEIAEERAEAADRDLIFDTDAGNDVAPMSAPQGRKPQPAKENDDTMHKDTGAKDA